MKAVKGILVVVVLAGLGTLAVFAFLEGRKELAQERELERPVKPPSRVTRGADGTPVVQLDAATQARVGLRVVDLQAATHRPEIVAYGRVEADPARTETLRAPIAGVLQSAKGRGWPRLGSQVAVGSDIGAVAPRVGPVDRAMLDARVCDWRARAAAARADEADARGKAESAGAARKGARDALSTAEVALERLMALQGPEKNVSERVVQEAAARVHAEAAQVKSFDAIERAEHARETSAATVARILEEAAAAEPEVDRLWPLRLGHAGEVVAVHAQPGETVVAAQPLLRVRRFDELLVRASLPLGVRLPPGATEALVFVWGRAEAPLRGRLVGRGTDASSVGGGEVVLVSFAALDASVRPGLAATVRIQAEGDAPAGVEIPRSAVVRFAGSAWVYVERHPGAFVRRSIALDRPTPAGWFEAVGFRAGDRVVQVGGATLLSEELKARIQSIEGEGG